MGTVRTERRGRVLVATLDNPPHGLMDAGTVAGLAAAAQQADADEEVGALVLTGAHPERFVAHYDVAELLAAAQGGPAVGVRPARASLRAVGALRRVPGAEGALQRTPAAGFVALERFHEALASLGRCGAVVVAAINGHAMGGGCELALACDVRLMADGDFGIGQPEILLGFPPGGGGTQRLTRLLGTAKALRICLDGGPLRPREAAELGLVDEVVPAEGLLDRAVAVGERLGARRKAAVRGAKRAVYEGGSLPLPDGLRLEASEFLATLASPQAIEAMQAYLERQEELGLPPAYDEATAERALEEGGFGR